MDKDIFGMMKALFKSKHAVLLSVFATFIFLLIFRVPIKTVVYYLVFVGIVSLIALLTSWLDRKISMPAGEKPDGRPPIPLDPVLMKFLRILERKGIKILREIEKAVKNMQKKAFFILESGESSPPVSVDKYRFCWSDVLKGNINELREFLRQRRRIKDVEFVDVEKSIDQDTIFLCRKNKTLSLTKIGRSIIFKDTRGNMETFISKWDKRKLNVYEKVGTRTTFFTQFINQKFALENRYRFPLIGTSSFLIFTKDISDELIVRDYRRFVKNKYEEIQQELKDSHNRYLFSWNKVKKTERERFMRFLREDVGIDWTFRAQVDKSQTNRIIEVKRGDKSLRFLRKKDKVFLEICDGRSYEFILVKENNEPKVYQNMRKTLKDWYEAFLNSSNLVLVTRPYGFSIDYAVKLFSEKMSKDELDRLTRKMMGVMQQRIVIQNIRFSYLFEAVGFGDELVREFDELEDKVVEKLAGKFGLTLTEEDYFCRLLSQENFFEELMQSTRKMSRSFISSIKKSKRKYTNLENLIGYLHKHLEAMV